MLLLCSENCESTREQARRGASLPPPAAALPTGDAVSAVGAVHMTSDYTAATHTHTHTRARQNVICSEDCSASAHSVPLVLFND